MNKKRLLTKNLPIVFMLLILLGFSNNLSILRKIENFSSYIQLYIKNEANSFDGKKASELLTEATKKKQEYSFVIWGKKMQESIFSKELDKNIETDVFVLQGNSQILFPEVAALYADNKTQCLVSSTLATELFGNKDVKGLIIVYNKKKYEILSTIPSKQSFFVYESADKEVAGMDRVTVFSPSKTNKVLLTKKFENQFSLKADLLDYDIFRVLLVIFNCLLLLITILVTSLFIYKNRKKYVLKHVKSNDVIVGLWLLSLVVMLVLFIQQFKISSEYLPAQLSDFSFFTNQKEKLADNLLILLQSKKYEKEFSYLANLWTMFVSSLTIFLLLIGCWWSFDLIKKNTLPSEKKKRTYQLSHISKKKFVRFLR